MVNWPAAVVSTSRQAGPLGGRLVIDVPVELPEAVQLHEFTVAVEKCHVHRAG